MGDSTEKVLSVLRTTFNKNYKASRKHGNRYQSIILDGIEYGGQRNISERIDLLDKHIDFKNKTVMDIGCNMGGVLHRLHESIKFGVGFDRCYRCINASNLICDLNKVNNLSFFVFDLDRDDIDLLDSFILHEKIDITFFMSVSHWIKKWRMVVDKIRDMSSIMIFESNGDGGEQLEQEEYIKSAYPNVRMISDESADDKSQKSRRLFICDIV
ncbi:MAG: hypothetical protein WC119_06075 [Synergistaceae bacterium]